MTEPARTARSRSGDPRRPWNDRLHGHRVSAGNVIACAAAAVFFAESLAFVALYAESQRTGFSLVLAVVGSPTYSLELVAVIVALPLTFFVLYLAQQRLQARLVAHWSGQREDARATARPFWSAFRTDSRAADLGFGAGAVLFFAETTTVGMTLLSGPTVGSSIVISTNALGEFWVEFPIVLAALALAGFTLWLIARDALGSYREHHQIGVAAINARHRRWLTATEDRAVPLRTWMGPTCAGASALWSLGNAGAARGARPGARAPTRG